MSERGVADDVVFGLEEGDGLGLVLSGIPLRRFQTLRKCVSFEITIAEVRAEFI